MELQAHPCASSLWSCRPIPVQAVYGVGHWTFTPIDLMSLHLSLQQSPFISIILKRRLQSFIIWISLWISWFILLRCTVRVTPVSSSTEVSFTQALLPWRPECARLLEWHWSSSPRGSCLRTMDNSTTVVVRQLGFVFSVTPCLLELGFLLSSPWISGVGLGLADLALPLVGPHGQPYCVFTGEHEIPSLNRLSESWWNSLGTSLCS